jgi:hypothetical protein
LGDADKLVPDGAQRIAALSDEPARLTATVIFAPQEHAVRLFGYATRQPTITAQQGSVGKVTFDRQTGRLEVSVSPGPKEAQAGPGDDPVRTAIVSLGKR